MLEVIPRNKIVHKGDLFFYYPLKGKPIEVGQVHQVFPMEFIDANNAIIEFEGEMKFVTIVE